MNNNFRIMTVWSGGNERAKNAKINAILYLISFCLIILSIILSFTINPNDDKTVPVTIAEHLFFGFFMMFMLGWIALLMFFGFKSELKNIKQNKLISLYLYDLENFSKIGGIPDEKFVLFSDDSGIVLADKKYENESRAFSFGAKHFYEFEKYV